MSDYLLDIKLDLVRFGIKKTEVARLAKRHKSTVTRALNGEIISQAVERAAQRLISAKKSHLNTNKHKNPPKGKQR